MRWTTLVLISAMLCSCCCNEATAQRAPTNWETQGDLTVVYRCRKRAIPEKVVIPEVNKRNLAVVFRRLAQQNGETLTDERIDRKVAQQVAEAEAPADTTPHFFVLTESVHGGSFLYKFFPETSDPACATFGQDTVVYNGVQTLSRLSSFSSQGSSVTISSGLNSTLLNVFPIYCARIASIPVMRNITQSGPNTYQAEVMHSGGGDSKITYMPATITTDSNAAEAHISHITVFAPWAAKGTLKYAEYELSDYVTSGAVVVPRRIHEVHYDTSNGDAPYHEVHYDTSNGDAPYLEYDYSLQSVVARSLASSAFESKSLLDSRSFISASAHGKDVAVPGYRSDMSVADQVGKAYIEQRASVGGGVSTQAAHPALWLSHGGEYNAGKVSVGSRLSYVVHVVNRSPNAVTVSATPCCGCTLGEERPHVIPPWGTLDYHVGGNVVPHRPGAYKQPMFILYCVSGARAWTQQALVRYTVP